MNDVERLKRIWADDVPGLAATIEAVEAGMDRIVFPPGRASLAAETAIARQALEELRQETWRDRPPLL